jgi:putative oxidoreductase
MSRMEKPGVGIVRDLLISMPGRLYPELWGRLAQYAPLALRLIVGFGFMEHGYAKLARGPEDFTRILHALHMPFPELLAWSTILVELLGGAAILLGAFVALASVPMAVVLLVAIFTVHLPFGFSSIKLQAITAAGAQFGQPGYETDLLYLACLAALVLGGAGPWSVEAALQKRSAPKADRWP